MMKIILSTISILLLSASFVFSQTIDGMLLNGLLTNITQPKLIWTLGDSTTWGKTTSVDYTGYRGFLYDALAVNGIVLFTGHLSQYTGVGGEPGTAPFPDEFTFGRTSGISGNTSSQLLTAINTGGVADIATIADIKNNGYHRYAIIWLGANDCNAQIATGTHEGISDSVLRDDSGTFNTLCGDGVNACLGKILNNTTDGSSCIITENTETTVTCSLSGGTLNAWNVGDLAEIASSTLASDAVSNIMDMVTVIDTFDSHIDILLVTLYEIAKGSSLSSAEFNCRADINTLLLSNITSSSKTNLSLVDIHTGWNPSTMGTGIHPVNLGYSYVGSQIVNVINSN